MTRQAHIEDIIDGLIACICCDEPDSDPFRREVKYWLGELVEWVGRGYRELHQQRRELAEALWAIILECGPDVTPSNGVIDKAREALSKTEGVAKMLTVAPFCSSCGHAKSTPDCLHCGAGPNMTAFAGHYETKFCLVCAYERPAGLRHEPTGLYICTQCYAVDGAFRLACQWISKQWNPNAPWHDPAEVQRHFLAESLGDEPMLGDLPSKEVEG